MNTINFGDPFFKFKVPDDIKIKLNHDDYIVLTEIGLPCKILSNRFNFYETVFEDSKGNIVLGFNTHVLEWELKISLIDFSIFYTGKGKVTNEIYAFYNSSVCKLLLSIFSYEFFFQKLVNSDLLGEYNVYHEKYAEILFELISDIDNKAISTGVWIALINEMRLGVM